MDRYLVLVLRFICTVSLLFSLVSTVHAQNPSSPLGQHDVQMGETLYCLGRAYGVHPAAIARANGLSPTARLIMGQRLTIPAEPWTKIPPGPVCTAQFPSPFLEKGISSPTSTPVAPDVAQLTATSTQIAATTYVVKRGDTLFRIARLFDVSVAAIQNANGMGSKTVIYVGQVLVIPGEVCDPAYPNLCIPLGLADLDCEQIPYRDFAVLPPDPHGFDGDGDGIGCEDSTVPLPPSGCPTGCIIRPPGCDIKGNISVETGEKIYHVPGGAFYSVTVINPDKGERWFCTEQEAIANGWRRSQR